MKPDKEKQRLEELIHNFKRIQNAYPGGGYDKIVAKLKQELVDHVNKIGRK